MPNCFILEEDEYITYGFVTGTTQSTLLSTQAEIAVSITEDAIEAFLNAALCPTGFTERHTWPGNQIWRAGTRTVHLEKNRIINIASITSYHEVDKCECDTNTYTGCHYIKEADTGIIEVYDDCWAVGECCAGCCNCTCGEGEAFMFDVSGTYGFTDAQLAADTSDGRTVRFWIAQWAQEVFDALGGSPSAVTATGVIQWASMNYSERKALVAQTMFGSSELANAMALGLRRLKMKRAIKFGGRR